MYTQCPQCETLFRISAEQLAQARGVVRCGLCAHCFNALESLSERPEPIYRRRGEAPEATRPPDARPTATDAHQPSVTETTDFAIVDIGADTSTPAKLGESVPAEFVHDQTVEHVALIADDQRDVPPLKITTDESGLSPPWIAAHAPHGRREPSLGSPDDEAETNAVVNISPEAREAAAPTAIAAPPRRRTTSATVAWAFANVALIFLLLGQYSYFHRDELAQYPELRPWLDRLCMLAGCEVPLQKDVSRIDLVNRVVQSHPQQDNALLIDATLVNDASFTQPYPMLELRFSDLNNRLVAGRRFRPEEYLAPGTDISQGMSPKEPVHLALEIADPGKDAVSFQFNLL